MLSGKSFAENNVMSNSFRSFSSQVVNVVVWSPCGKFLAAGTVGGNLLIWDVEAKLCIERLWSHLFEYY